MKLTFLGTGTSTGVPQINCNCTACRSTDSRDKRLRASVLLTFNDMRQLLIDCGPDFRRQALDNPINHLRGVLLTHTHYDHVGGLDDLRPFCASFKNGLPLYARADVIDDQRNRMPYSFVSHIYPGVPVFETHEIQPYVPFAVDGDIEVMPIEVFHHKLPILGFIIGNIAYITDCKTMPDRSLKMLRGIDTLVLNALRIEEHLSHLNLRQAIDIISTVSPRRAYLTHISHDMGLHAEVSMKLPGNVELATDNLVIDI